MKTCSFYLPICIYWGKGQGDKVREQRCQGQAAVRKDKHSDPSCGAGGSPSILWGKVQ